MKRQNQTIPYGIIYKIVEELSSTGGGSGGGESPSFVGITDAMSNDTGDGITFILSDGSSKTVLLSDAMLKTVYDTISQGGGVGVDNARLLDGKTKEFVLDSKNHKFDKTVLVDIIADNIQAVIEEIGIDLKKTKGDLNTVLNARASHYVNGYYDWTLQRLFNIGKSLVTNDKHVYDMDLTNKSLEDLSKKTTKNNDSIVSLASDLKGIKDGIQFDSEVIYIRTNTSTSGTTTSNGTNLYPYKTLADGISNITALKNKIQILDCCKYIETQDINIPVGLNKLIAPHADIKANININSPDCYVEIGSLEGNLIVNFPCTIIINGELKGNFTVATTEGRTYFKIGIFDKSIYSSSANMLSIVEGSTIGSRQYLVESIIK